MPEQTTSNRLTLRTRHDRGFALIMVLWAAVLLALIVGAIASAVRTDLKLTSNQVQAARAELAADAALWISVRQLERLGPQVWLTNGTVYSWTYDGLNVRVRTTDEYGRVDINHAPIDVLTRLFAAAGQDQSNAIRLASAIANYRKARDQAPSIGRSAQTQAVRTPAFNSSDEVLLVPGIGPALFQSIEAAITVYSGQDRPPFGMVSPLAQVAVGLKPQDVSSALALTTHTPANSNGTATPQAINRGGPAATGFSGLIRVEAEALSDEGAHYARTAVLFMPVQPGDPVRTYLWTRGVRQFFPLPSE